MKKSILIFLFYLSACNTTRITETQLFFGQNRMDGTEITSEEWTDFKQTFLRSYFTAGFTELAAKGSWYDSALAQNITEPTILIIYIHPQTQAESLKIDSLRNVYKSIFQQQSVLRTDKKIKLSL